MKAIYAVALGVPVAFAVFGQAPRAKLEFEVASVRPSQTSGPDRVALGLRLDGAQAHISSLTIRDYIAIAYRVKAYQVSGPDWTGSDRFDLDAKLPAGSTSDQIPEMLQALLAERFQLKLHHDKKDLPVYALTIGKPPLKLKETPPDAQTGDAKGTTNVAASGSAAGVSVDLGNGSYYTFADGKFEAKKISMDRLATMLERYADRPILDLTGLKGNYDLAFDVTEEDYRALLIRGAVNSGVVLPPRALRVLDEGSASPLFDAMQKLGLKLDARKAPVDLLVIDQVLKKPTDN